MSKKHYTDSLLTLLLLAIFGVCVLLVLLSGAKSYRNVTQRDSASYDRRTAAQYLTTRVRQGDAAGELSASSFQGTDALVFSQEIDGSLYHTRVYCWEGYLRELFTPADSDLMPGDGEKVLPCQALTVRQEAGIFRLILTLSAGEQETLWLSLRSGEEELP